ncbi:MAG: leucine-rich repeat protein, partial [Oscillospiraceae bacterium]|nr:leucine-rich repeat protein [Oscillospiraceae bacterium]
MRKNLKRSLAVIMAVLVLMTSAPLAGFVGLELPEWSQLFTAKASAASSDYLTSGFCGEVTETTDGTQLSWVLDDAGTLTVTGTGRMAAEAFKYDLRIKNVVIGEGVENIASYAFRDCTNLVSVDVQNGAETIDNYAFYECSKLTDITLPDSLTSIGLSAFGYCSALTNITLPDSLTSIGLSAFRCCYALTDIVLPDSVTSIGSDAFAVCSSLATVTIGSGLKSLSVDAFNYCSKLSTISVSKDNTAYASVDGIVYNKEKTKLLIVPAAISGEITIPATVEEFTYKAVDSCENLTAIHVEDGNLNYKSVDGIVYTADGKTVLCCPRGKVGSVDVQNGAETIDKFAFYNCSKLTDITLPDSLTSIGYDAFYNCYALKSINILPAITKISNSIFAYCGFTNLTLPETVQSFDHASWSKLKILTIENKYCKYTSTAAPSFPADCTVRAYCGSPGHELAVKRLLNFESLGHTYLGWYTVTPATYEADGIERRDCTYCGGYEERVIPKLQQDVFTATFVADGETIATVDFPKGAEKIEEPAVPAKDRYIGEWEDYTLSDSNLTINAVYTLIKSENASDIHTSSDVVHYTDADDVLLKLRAWSDAKVVKSTVSKSVPLDIVLVVDQSGSMDETLGSSTKKIDALKNTAKEFIHTVFENAKMTGADHRISLVGFGLSGDYKGFEKNENTELLTSERGIVKFENIKSSDYASSLLSVSEAGEVNEALLNAVDSIEARGATAADLGFEMAKGVFANTDSTDRQRVVVFMTDGEPTYLSGFQTSVANSAIANAATLKKAYDASIYSVGVFSQRESEDANINRFMNAVSSGYPDAQSMRYPGDGTDGLFYTTVSNTDTLSSVFKSISTEALSHTAPFDNLTVIKTLSKYVTMTSQQEEKLRVDLIREYGITNDDIIITRNADATTTVQVNNLTPKETTDENGNVIYEVKFEFFASLNEKAAQIGEYTVDTEDSGVMLGADAKGYEATF